MEPRAGVKMQAFNWELWTRREERGLTQLQLATLAGISTQSLSRIERLLQWPALDVQEELAAALDCDPSILFPAELRDLVAPDVASTVRFPVAVRDLLALQDGGQDLDAKVLASGLAADVEEALSGLAPREREVLRRRFGLSGEQGRTLEEVGREFHVTRERIRMIENKALRKLRHLSRSKKLRDYLEEEGAPAAPVPIIYVLEVECDGLRHQLLAPFGLKRNVACGRVGTNFRRADPATPPCFRCSCVFLDRVPQPDVRVLAGLGLWADARTKTIGPDHRLHFVPDLADMVTDASFRLPLPRALCRLPMVMPDLAVVAPEEWERERRACPSCLARAGSL